MVTYKLSKIRLVKSTVIIEHNIKKKPLKPCVILNQQYLVPNKIKIKQNKLEQIKKSKNKNIAF